MSQFRQYSAQSSSPAHTHDPNEMFQCLWDWDYGLHCNEVFSGDNLSAHLRGAHNIHGADKLRVYCLWDGCGSEMNKESLVMHVEERHLRIVYRCDPCGKSYRRRDTLSKHMKACTGS